MGLRVQYFAPCIWSVQHNSCLLKSRCYKRCVCMCVVQVYWIREWAFWSSLMKLRRTRRTKHRSQWYKVWAKLLTRCTSKQRNWHKETALYIRSNSWSYLEPKSSVMNLTRGSGLWAYDLIDSIWSIASSFKIRDFESATRLSCSDNFTFIKFVRFWSYYMKQEWHCMIGVAHFF